MMQQLIAQAHRGLAWFILVGLLVQFYLAGTGIFGASSFALHIAWGNLMGISILLLLILALVGRVGRRLIGLTMLLLVLYMVQVALPGLRASLPYVSALHVVNALALLGVTHFVARAERTLSAATSRTRATMAGNP
jgi:hypothetical protein